LMGITECRSRWKKLEVAWRRARHLEWRCGKVKGGKLPEEKGVKQEEKTPTTWHTNSWLSFRNTRLTDSRKRDGAMIGGQ
jgi:hypothetical protein